MFKFDKDYIINIVKNNRTIISWPLLYDKLGISGILTYLGKYDIKHIFMKNDLIQEINNIMISNMKSLKKSEITYMIINDGRHIPRVERIAPKKPARL